MVSKALFIFALPCVLQVLAATPQPEAEGLITRDTTVQRRPAKSSSNCSKCHWSPDVVMRDDDPCIAAPKAVLLYHGYNAKINDNFYTTSEDEIKGVWAGDYAKEQPYTARIFRNQEENTIPLHRLWSGNKGDHFYTTSEADRQDFMTQSYGYERIEGYVYETPICCSVPLYQLSNPQKVDHLYTASNKELAAMKRRGYKKEKVLGYVLPLY